MICKLCGQPMVKHVDQEGSRFHVHSYDAYGIHCNEPNCEDNHGYGKCIGSERHMRPIADKKENIIFTCARHVDGD